MNFFRKMKFFRRSQKRQDLDDDSTRRESTFGFNAGWSRLGGLESPNGAGDHMTFPPTAASARALARFPPPVLDRLFSFVCPHAQDESYDTCEQSAIEDACMLCDMRDLAHCIATCKQWRREGRKRLYHSIRIDSVHYCDREIYLSEKRKRRSFFDRNGEPEDTPGARLKLLCRTLREDAARLGPLVIFLKTPYMLRESSQADLARTIAVLPNLHYVDLPEGLFVDDPAYVTLRLELQARCLELRKMTYMAGSERSLEALGGGNVWRNLEVLELIRINIDPVVLRQVLGMLWNLRALKVSETKMLNDDVLRWHDTLPPFPALQELILNDVPNITSEGLREYLSRADASESLRVLTLTSTGVKPWAVHEVLGAATSLRHLSIADSVTASLSAAAGTNNVPPLASQSLQTLHYEITSSGGPTAAFSSTTSSYYAYLALSLLSAGLPQLRALYVRDPTFPDLLLGLSPPTPGFASGSASRPRSAASSGGFLTPSHTGGGGGLPSPVSPRQAYSSHQANPFQPRQQDRQPLLSPATTGSSSTATPAASATPTAHMSAVPNGPHSLNQQQLGSKNPFAYAPSASSTSPPHTSASSAAPTRRALSHTLEIFTKGDDEPDWSFVKVGGPNAATAKQQQQSSASARSSSIYAPGALLSPASPTMTAGSMTLAPPRRSTAPRPLSGFGLGADLVGGFDGGPAGFGSGGGGGPGLGAWSAGAGARRSVMVGDGSGGFLAVPTAEDLPAVPSAGAGWAAAEEREEWPRPRSEKGEKRRKREEIDLWR